MKRFFATQTSFSGMKFLVKTTGLLLVVGLLLTSCCKKEQPKEEPHTPSNYSEITKDDIAARASQMSSDDIAATYAGGHILDVGDVLIYKTNGNHYGKMQILAIDDSSNYKLTIKAVSYKDDGSVFSETTSLDIRGTWTCDLDAMQEAGPDDDFQWNRLTTTATKLSPINTAVFAVYHF